MEDEKLIELLSDMSLKEKIGQLLQLDGYLFEEGTTATGPASMGFNEEDIALCGSALNIYGAENIRNIQQKAIKRQPHNIPLIFMYDIINGCRTIFPVPLAQGCTFDEDLVERAASVAAREASAAGLHLTFSPMADLARDARWGRVMESTGEDKYLNSKLATAMVKGYQGKDLKQKGKIAACVKHFAAYGLPTGGREYNNVELSERTLREDYLPAYQAAIKAGAATVMTSFNSINRVPATGNSWLMREILRDEFGFDGVLISDYAAIKELVSHTIAENNREAAKLAIHAGVDIDMVSPVYVRHLEGLVKEGAVSEKLIDEAVMRVLRLKNQLGLFENPYKDGSSEEEQRITLCEEHRKLAREMSQKSFVLLKNGQGCLPLAQEGKKYAFIGPYVDNQHIFGSWALLGRQEDSISIKQAIKNRQDVIFAKGCGIISAQSEVYGFGAVFHEKMIAKEEQRLMAEAVDIAKTVDTVVLCLGEHPHQSGEGASSADLRLPKHQRRLLAAIREVNQNIVLVLFSGRPMEITKECDMVKSVLMVWFPGTEGGNAIVDVLFGHEQPGGRLSMSVPYSVGQVPVFYGEFTTGRPYQENWTYKRFLSRYQDIPNRPLYPFGFGLSYTEFKYSEVELSTNLLEKGKKVEATVTLTNTGEREGIETVQLYIRDVAGSVIRPVKELKGIKKIRLAAGESIKISFQINKDMLKFYNFDGKFAAEPGSFQVFIGPDSSTHNMATFTLVE